MISLNINNDKLLVKQVLGIYQELPSYPDDMDVIFYLVNWAKINCKSSDEEITFNDMFLCKKFNKNREEIKSILSNLIKKGWVSHVKDTDIKSIYALIDNPFA